MNNVLEYRRTEPEQPLRTSSSTGSTGSTSSVQHYQKKEDALIRVSCEALREMYQECIGRPMTQSIHRHLLQDLVDGTPYEYYRYALDEAAMAPQPSWRYVMAIVGRLARERVPPESLSQI